MLAFVASSCVSSKKFKISEAQRTKAETDIRRLKADTTRVGALVRENLKTIASLKTQIAGLEQDTLKLGKDLRDCRKESKLVASTGKATKEDLEGKLKQKQQELADKEAKIAEKERLLREKEAEAKEKAELLASKEREAKEKSDLLVLKEKEAKEKADLLALKEKEAAEKEKLLQDRESELQAKSKRVEELEAIINKQNENLNALQNLISSALVSFKSDELTVETRNGKVYVSMSDKLLFQSGSTEVDVKGKEALQKLAVALQKQPDITIAVEGHTDNVPISSGKYADNWDLSVLRATSIIRILGKYGLSPQRVTASGRGEHFPVADNSTKEGRAKNRRTEIILSPKLDDLMGVIRK